LEFIDFVFCVFVKLEEFDDESFVVDTLCFADFSVNALLCCLVAVSDRDSVVLLDVTCGVLMFVVIFVFVLK